MWLYEGKELEQPPDDCYGFVYEITNLVTGKKYIGRKFFTKAGYKQVKGKRKKIRKPSDWENYYGSSKNLLDDIEKYGKEYFRRDILRLCKTRAECTYYESKYQFDLGVLHALDFSGERLYYNDWIVCKIHSKSVRQFMEKSNV